MKHLWKLVLVAILAPTLVFGQGAALVHKPITTGHCASWFNANTLQDAGAICGSGSGGVTSFNTRTGAVTLTSGDVSTALGYAPATIASPQFTGTPGAPTATFGDSSTQLANTAFVQAAVTAGVAGVSSFNTRTGAVSLLSADVASALGYTAANIASPTFTGVPAAPTASFGTNTTQLASTAFVQAAVAGSSSGVSSFNTRTGAVTLGGSDVTTALGYTPANIASPAFTGAPTSPTATFGDNTTKIASTAFVQAAVVASTTGVASFNTRTGAVTLSSSDISIALGYTAASISANLSDLANISTARSNLGSTVVGDALFTTFNNAAARTTLGLGTSSVLNVGTSANNVVQLDGSAKLPAVDGSQLTNLPTSGGAPVLLATLTASNSASLTDVSDFTSTYKQYRLDFYNILPVTNTARPVFTFSTDGGATWLSSGYLGGSASLIAPVVNVTPGAAPTGSFASVSNVLGGITGTVTLFRPASPAADTTQIIGTIAYGDTSAGWAGATFTGTNSTTSAINGLKFAFASGNISSGSIKIFGIP